MTAIPLDRVYFDTEPHIPVVGGPLCDGYALCLAGREADGIRVIEDFLVSVYPTRPGEISTRVFLKGEEAPEAIRAACRRRIETMHLPLLASIRECGYFPGMGNSGRFPVTMRAAESTGRYYVVDGKNRCSILAALGHERIEGVIML